MNEPSLPDMQNLPQPIYLILLSGRIGLIANTIAQKMGIDGLSALEQFYTSQTCQRLHDKETELYLRGDLYIAEEFLIEMHNA